MERTLSPDERIRRAEEIYQKRRNSSNRINQARVNVSEGPKDFSLFRKMFLQIAICLCIYSIFYLIKNSNYIFSEDFLAKSKDLLTYDINVTEKYKEIKNWFVAFYEKDMKNNISNQTENNIMGNTTLNIIEENQNILPETNMPILATAEDSSSISQTANDAKEINEKYSLIKPLEGTITSRFGVRNPTTETVPKYHTGIDIAANTGTVFIASMDGTVVQVSSEGDFRKSFKNSKR